MGCGKSAPVPSTFDKEQMRAVEDAKAVTLPPREDIKHVTVKASAFVN